MRWTFDSDPHPSEHKISEQFPKALIAGFAGTWRELAKIKHFGMLSEILTVPVLIFDKSIAVGAWAFPQKVFFSLPVFNTKPSHRVLTQSISACQARPLIQVIFERGNQNFLFNAFLREKLADTSCSFNEVSRTH